MDSWVVWMIVAGLLGVGEMLTMGLYLAPFTVGALAAAGLSLAGLGTPLAFVAFLLGSLAVFGLIRPVARRHLKTPPRIRTGTAALVGSPATVLERIVNHEAVGCVKIGGEVWTARAYDDDAVYEIGQRLQVVEIRGATALVAE